jgi:hypothetical protein
VQIGAWKKVILAMLALLMIFLENDQPLGSKNGAKSWSKVFAASYTDRLWKKKPAD